MAEKEKDGKSSDLKELSTCWLASILKRCTGFVL